VDQNGAGTMIQLEIKKLDYTMKNERSDTKINIIARDDDGNRIKILNDEHDSYFYIPKSEYDGSIARKDSVINTEEGFTSIRDEEMVRVYTQIPGDVPNLRGEYNHREADILYPNRFSLDTGIYGGIEIPDEYSGQDVANIPLDDINSIDYDTETRIMFCDIEVNDENGFPDETEGKEEIVCITLYDTFTQQYYTYLYKDNCPELDVDAEYVDDVSIEIFDTEVEMLKTFADTVNKLLPDVIAGWNLKKFDAMYLISRFDTLDELDSSDLSPLGSAYNDGWFGGKIKGISVFDMLKAYKNLQFTELDSFSLEDVAQEELGIGKLEEGEERIHKLWENDINSLLEYNIRDVYLTVELERTQDIIKFYEEVAEFVGGRLSEVVDFSKAADIYVLRQVNGEYVVPSADTVSGDDQDFEGAAVFDPVSEIKEMISVLDLASLYPYTIKTLNAGPRTKDVDGDITAPNGISFSTDEKSIISDIIDNLVDEREKKKEQRTLHSPGGREYVKYDLQQRAIKVITNTLYGILAWNRFRLYDVDVAAAVTATGREVIKFTEEKVNEMGYSVVYGDSVPEYEPVIIKTEQGMIRIERIGDLEDIEQSYEVWSDEGFTQVKHIIKKKKRDKDIYRVRTKSGICSVTEDHSLLTDNAKEVSPKNISEGDKLMHNDLGYIEPDTVDYSDISQERAWVLGLFVAEGSCGIYDYDDHTKYSWAINGADRDILEKAGKIMTDEFSYGGKIMTEESSYEYNIMDVRESSNVYKLSVRGDVKLITKVFRDMCYSGDQKTVPNKILNSNESIIRSFLDGYFVGDGYESDRYNKQYQSMTTKDPCLALSLVYLLRQLDIHVNVGLSHGQYYRIRSVNYHRGSPISVQDIDEVEYDGKFVYDLETENNHFNCGAGHMTVHNTDSVMAEFDDASTIDEVIYRSLRMEQLINDSYDKFAKQELNADEHYFEIEFEKVYRTYIQAGKKKRYAGHIVWKEGKETNSIDIVGLEFQRSDYSTAAKKLQEKAIRAILMGAEKNEIRELVSTEIDKIKSLTYSLDELGIPGGIGRAFDEYTNKTKHVRGAEYANEHLDEQIQAGDKPKGIYVERIPEYPSPPSLQESKFVCWMNSSNVPNTTVYDWEKYLNIQVDNPLSTVFGCTQWSWEEITSGEDQSNVHTFGDENGNELSTFETDADLETSTRSAETVPRVKDDNKQGENNDTTSTIPERETMEVEQTDDAMAVFETTSDLESNDGDTSSTEQSESEEIEVIEFDDVELESNNDDDETQSDLGDF